MGLAEAMVLTQISNLFWVLRLTKITKAVNP
jgi:hypothetical protein